MRTLLVALALVSMSASTARADSDGYYCTGPGYLAVEFRSFNTPGLSGPHVLKIVRFDAAAGPRWAGEVVLEDFQPHRLTCSADGVRLEHWGRKGLLAYDIALDANRVPRIRARVADAAPKARPLYPTPDNLGELARPGITPIPAPGEPHRFQLHVTRSTGPAEGGIRHLGSTVLEELDQSGKIARSLLLHRNDWFEPVH